MPRYFDAVSPNGAGLQIVFYSGYGFGALSPVPYYVQISGNLANGTTFDTLGVYPNGYGTVKQSVGGYSNGDWGPIGGWRSTAEGYVVTFTDNLGTVSGNLTLNAVAPPHLPCEEYEL